MRAGQNGPTGLAAGFGRSGLYLAAALVCIVLESFTAFDQLAQRPFFQQGAWLLSRAFHGENKGFLYTGPKILIGLVAGVFFIIFLLSLVQGQWKKRLSAWRKPALLVSASIVFVPLFVSAFKAVSGVYGPVDLLPYGGQQPHAGLLEQVWLYGQTAGGRSFPAGHASGGFALMSLYHLPLAKGWKNFLFGLGFVAGWAMGLYQMARGEHFLTHTLTTMFLALAIITFLARLIRVPAAPSVNPSLDQTKLQRF